MSKHRRKRSKSPLGGWIAIAIAVLIVAGIASVWARDYLPVKDQPGKRIYITANQAVKWVEKKPVAFLQLSWSQCPACIAAGPAIEKLVAEYDLHLAYVDIRERGNEWIAEEYRLQSTPSIYPFKDGKLAGPPIVGNVGEDGFREFFLKYLEPDAS